MTNDDDRHRFVRTLAGTVEAHDVLCHAWVLMTNHYHLVVETPRGNLSDAIRHLNGTYSQWFNREHERVGHLFQGRFTGILVEKESYLLEVCRYVVLNPVRAGLVGGAADWPWSSYHATSGTAARPAWLTTEWLLGHFGRSRAAAEAAYVRFVAEGAARGRPIWLELRGRGVLGTEGFAAEVQARVGANENRELLPPVVARRPAAPDVSAVLEEVADAYGIPLATLFGRRRKAFEPRDVAMYAARRIARLRLAAVADRFGVALATVTRAVHRMDARMKQDPEFRAWVEAGPGKRKDRTQVKTERPDPR